MKLGWVIAAAVLFGVPATAVYVAVLPVAGAAVVAAVITPTAEGLWVALELICGGVALVAYWRIAVAAAHAREVRLTPSYVLGLVAAVIAASFFIRITDFSALSVVVVIAMAGSTLALLRVQNRRPGA